MKPRICRQLALATGDAPLTVVSPPVRADGSRRPKRVACRADAAAARRTERATIDRCFRYYVDTAGRQHFNFVQQVWLRPQVEMAVTSVPTVALETLAVNLLTLVTRRRDCTVAVGMTSRTVMQLADSFCTECLLSAGANGWVMPRSAVRAWLATRLRRRARSSR